MATYQLVCKGNATVGQVETYLYNKGTECPVCGNGVIYGYGSDDVASDLEGYATYTVSDVRCDTCKSRWKEYHLLVGIDLYSIAGQ